MYKTANGDEIFVVDGHVHYWDGRPENFLNVHGEQFIDCFYGYHKALSPPDRLWPKDKFRRYSIEDMHRDLFLDGYVDVAVFQPTYLKDFYKNGFNTTEQNALLKEKYPEKFVLNGSFDPRDGARGLDTLRAKHEKYNLRGVKLYTAEWKGDSRGWKLTDSWAERYLAECQKLGITNIHVHKGPTILPLNRDAFDVADIDSAATNFPELNFIVEHCGLPRLDDFCWIAVQEPNVYGGLAVAMAFIHCRPDYFNHVLSELLFWLGSDRLTFASDYGIWTPKWIIDKFMALDFPDEIKRDKGVSLDLDVKRKILGLNAARLYDLEVPAPMRIADRASDSGSARQVVEQLEATP